ncbi:uncharacterized protein LOC100367938 [Saccoglossus kowalevskii]|uniref:Uncharacterized protein LOC100367938 n=1 Tax=Saccoglossus kowalevskii TaxID=10224 RepID=A0ABM0GXM9_SACKO|nr:PREDICTED: uncharacterized protein LOC100367938 [Saccoglossus kowalevskii]
MDYYSNYFEIDHLYEETASEIIKRTKRHFSVHGIPDQYYSDNIPYNSKEFRDFAKDYEFELITSSPEYPQSNGKVENAVKTAKLLMKKSKDAETNTSNYLIGETHQVKEWEHLLYNVYVVDTQNHCYQQLVYC